MSLNRHSPDSDAWERHRQLFGHLWQRHLWQRLHEDKASGVLNGRKGLTQALKGCAAGDVLVVWKLDRLARSLHDLVVIAEDLKGRNVGLKILTGEGAAVDTTHAQDRMIFGILAVMAEFEREMISERTVA